MAGDGANRKKTDDAGNPLPRLATGSGRSRLTVATLAGVVALAVLATHWPVLSTEALGLDDGKHVFENPLVQEPGLESAGRLLSEVLHPSTGGYYKPLSIISLMLDRAVAGRPDDLRQFRRTSLALHVANTALIVVLLYQLFGQPWAAALAGLLFGMHPITVEAIPWAAERKTLLAAFFALCCLNLYVRYVRHGNAWRWFLAASVMYLCALLSKPTSIPLVALLLLLDYWPLRRLRRRAFFEKIPLFALAAASVAVTWISQTRTLGVGVPGTEEYPPMRAPLVLCHNIIFYLYKVLWPVNLSAYYPYPDPLTISHPMVLCGVVGTAVLIVALVISWRWTPALLVGWVFFFVAIFPALGVIGFMGAIAADRFAYLPAVGLLLVVAHYLVRLWGHPKRLLVLRVAMIVVVVALAGLEARATRNYIAVWRTTESLARHMVAHAPQSPQTRGHLAYALGKQGRTEEAIEHYEAALDLWNGDLKAHYNLAILLDRQERVEESARHHAEALRIDPDYAPAHVGLGVALGKLGRIEEAIHHCRQAVKLKPRYADAHNNLGVMLSRQDKTDEAIAHFIQALQSDPLSHQAHYNLGDALVEQGRAAEALPHFENALKLKPDYADAHFRMGQSLREQGMTSEAVARYAQAIAIDPDHVQAHLSLAVLLTRRGEIDQALVHYQEVVRIKPGFAKAHNDLGTLWTRKGQWTKAEEHYRNALRLDPGNAMIHSNLGRALFRQRRLSEAIGECQEALRLDPADVRAQINLGNALRGLGRVPESTEAFRQAVSIGPDDAEAHFHLGIAWHDEGKLDAAIAEYRTVLKINPAHAKARQALELALTAKGQQRDSSTNGISAAGSR